MTVLFSASVIVFIWIAWKSWRSLSKERGNKGKKIIVLLLVLFFGGILWIGWKFQPWMPAGRAVHIGSTHLGDYDFQIWQRKNAGVGEPFATALFVRKRSGRWNAFSLDFEDTYRPAISLRKEDSGIAVLYGRTQWGHFNEAQEVLIHVSNGSSFPIEGTVIDSDPPGTWWLKQSSMP
jgi:hypothetical protein